MCWTGLALAADQEEDVDTMLRAAWNVAYSDAFARYRCAVFRGTCVHGKPTLYFSPEARELGAAFGATPYQEPRRKGLRLIAGDRKAWDACFPEWQPHARKQGTLHLPKPARLAYEDFQTTFKQPLSA